MRPYREMSKDELTEQQAELTKQFEDAKGMGLKLDMSRGKPTSAQLDMTMGLMDVLNSDSDMMTMVLLRPSICWRM